MARQKKYPQWKKNNGDFIPYPQTWLNQRRWEDDAVIEPKQDDSEVAWTKVLLEVLGKQKITDEKIRKITNMLGGTKAMGALNDFQLTSKKNEFKSLYENIEIKDGENS